MLADVEIKGIREGLLVTIGDGEWDDVQSSLLAEMDKQVDFLQGAKLILDVSEHEIGAAKMGKLRDQFSDRGLSLWAVLSQSESTEQTAQNLGFATRIHNAEHDEIPDSGNSELIGQEATFIKRTLRSGNSLTFPGHVTVIGDVNPGAEIVAGGDVIIWGRLRGMVHAGAEGDESAIVCALDLSPTQLRIASHIAIPPEQSGEPQPELASLRDGQVLAEPWMPTKHS
jgi:septum site-determining protein MinC